MSTHKHINKICVVAVIVSLLLCIVFMNGQAFGVRPASRSMGYETRLFDTSRVHTIDIIIDDWDGFLETARSEEYSVCSVVIDGEAVKNVGIRGKGNTSLSSVAGMGSSRYSFKIEFDQYDSTKTYHGLDKLSLNNVIQDNTYMKDYLTYQMMVAFGVAAPLSSFAYITVNGEDWGLYLAVEAVEEAFLQRNYGSDYGDLYKPDGMNMGGGRGNGKDFEMPDFSQLMGDAGKSENSDAQGGRGNWDAMMRPGEGNGNMPAVPEGMQFPGGMRMPEGMQMPGGMQMPEGMRRPGGEGETADRTQPGGGRQMPEGGFGGFGGMGSAGTKLQYVDDNPASYSVIFDSAKTEVSKADQTRLIASLKQLSEYENLEEVVDVDDVLRYFVVHNYVVNGDSYPGNMIHNYYLYEEDGRLSMIPWDYNLAYGTFQGGNAASSVNDDIDKVLSDRPMQAWIFSDEAYSRQYYDLYAEFLKTVDAQQIIDHAYELIAPYVAKDPTAFCTYEEFETGVAVMKKFCSLRAESVGLQLAGSTETVDAGDLNLSQMGSMGRGFGNTNRDNAGEGAQRPAGMPDRTQANQQKPTNDQQAAAEPGTTGNPMGRPEGNAQFGGFAPPEGMGFGGMGGDRGMTATQPSGPSTTSLVLLASSVLALAVGLVLAKKFRR